MINDSSILKTLTIVLAVALVAFATVSVAQDNEFLPPSVAEELDEATTTLMELGQSLAKEQRFDEAEKVFKDILGKYPQNAEAYYHLGAINIQQKRFEQGVAYLKRSVSLAPDNVQLRFSLARAYEEARMLENAIEEYRNILQMAGTGSPEYSRAEKRLSITQIKYYGGRGDAAQALQYAEKLAEQYPDDPTVLRQVGLTYMSLRRYDDAERIFIRMVNLLPNNAVAELYLAGVYEAMRNMDEAERHFKRVIEKDSLSPPARTAKIKLGLIRGGRYLEKGELFSAQREYEKVLELEPGDPLALMNLGMIYQQSGNTAQAEETFKTILEGSPGNLEVQLRLASLYLDTGRFLEGVEALDKIIAVAPQSLQAKKAQAILEQLPTRIGRSAEDVRRFAARTKELKQAISENPDDVKAHFELADIYSRQGERQEARKSLEEVVRIDPELLEPRLRLGLLYEDLQMFEEAIEQYESAEKLATDAPEQLEALRKQLIVVRGKNAYVRGTDSRAREYFLEILVEDPGNSTALWFLALIQTRQGDYEGAIKSYNKLLEKRPDNFSAHLNLGLLYEQLDFEEDAISQYRLVIRRTTNEGMKDTAETRLKALQRRNKGFAFSAGYALALDSNANLNDEDPTFEYRSDTFGNLVYNHRIKRYLRFSFAFSPTYAIYHIGGYDFLTTAFRPSFSIGSNTLNLNVGYEYSRQSGVLRADDSISITNQVFTDGTWRIGGTGTLTRFSVSFRDFESRNSPWFSARTLRYALFAYPRLPFGLTATYSYRGAINENTEDNLADPLLAAISNEYAYVSQGGSVRIDRQVIGRMSAYANASFDYFFYTNESVFFGDKRRNWNLALSLGANYNVIKSISIFGSYIFQVQRSNLPAFGFNALRQIESQDSGSLGDYTRHILNFGFRVSF